MNRLCVPAPFHRLWLALLVSTGLALSGPIARSGTSDLERGFRQPPDSARPWVYWFWLNGNITSNGITADLEAMQRVGIGGVLIMEVDQGAPAGPVGFMSPEWRRLFGHVVREAKRLGLEVNLNNDAGWNGSGGPWIGPEQSMQKVVFSEIEVEGPSRFDAVLAVPPTVAGWYRDIAVLAWPASDGPRIDRIQAKAGYEVAAVGESAGTNLPPEQVIRRDRIVDLTAGMDAGGRLTWGVPEGRWTILRLGHTSTGVENAPAPACGRGLECDKLSAAGIGASFGGMMARLVDDVRSAGPRALVATHIDSWENGAQNWTRRMREEFRVRRGYDLGPFLPVLTGRVIDSAEIAERFLWDLRRTISELVVEEYAGGMRRLAHARGLRFTVEAYGGPCDCLPYAGQSDEPMGEFWSPSGAMETCRGMASAGHVYGKPIIGAEAFTAGDGERWLEHPAAIKALGDRAVCEGINRLVFHRYALQPWAEARRPGMTMGPWGQHYERTQTWWAWTPAWHTYLARCQFLLRQGHYVADVCFLQAEQPPQGFGNHRLRGYAWDECPAEVVLERMSVRDGRIVLPDGMSYRVLVLPDTRRMTPALLGRILALVEAGATVIGPRPDRSPSLSGYPECDAEVRRLGAMLWGDCDGDRVREHLFGRGRVVWGRTPEQVLEQAKVLPDFVGPPSFRYLHRAVDDTQIYFVAQGEPYGWTATGSFRVSGRTPELWWPDTGRIETAPLFHEENGVTHVVLPMEPAGSVFVVFRKPVRGDAAGVALHRDGKTVLAARPEPPPAIVVRQARYGVLDDRPRTREVTSVIQRRVDAGETVIVARSLAADGDPAPGVVKTLRVEYAIEGKAHVVEARDPDAIHLTSDALSVRVESARYGVLEDPSRTRDVREKVQRIVDAGETRFTVARLAQGDDPAFLVVKTLELDYWKDGERRHATGKDPDTILLAPPVQPPGPIAWVRRNASGGLVLEGLEDGDYQVTLGSGRARAVTLRAPVTTQALEGPWTVRFEGGSGAPRDVTVASLLNWAEHPDPAVKYYSGAATYTRRFELPRGMRGGGRRLELDLGEVAIMAQVRLNGRDLGTLWKPPFVVDITGAARRGGNALEVRVVNLWVNRMIGDEQLPEDSDRNPDGTLKRWPEWLLEGRPSPTGRQTFTTWRLWKKDAPLQPSGLLGPVRLRSIGQARIP